MWVYFCWLQISWVCCCILKTIYSCPGLTPMLHSTIGLTAGSAEHSPLHQWKASQGGHPQFKEKTSSRSVNIFDNNHMWCLFFIWWHLPTLKWTGATLYSNYGHNVNFNFDSSIASLWETLTSSPWWTTILITIILVVLFLLFAPCICNCITGFVSSRKKAFKLQMVAQTPATAVASSSYYLGPLDQISSIWGLGEYVASPI